MCPHRIICEPHLDVMPYRECEYPHPSLFIGVITDVFRPPANSGKLKLTVEVGGTDFHAEVREEWFDVEAEIGGNVAIHAYYPHPNSNSILVPRPHSHSIRVLDC